MKSETGLDNLPISPAKPRETAAGGQHLTVPTSEGWRLSTLLQGRPEGPSRCAVPWPHSGGDCVAPTEAHAISSSDWPRRKQVTGRPCRAPRIHVSGIHSSTAVQDSNACNSHLPIAYYVPARLGSGGRAEALGALSSERYPAAESHVPAPDVPPASLPASPQPWSCMSSQPRRHETSTVSPSALPISLEETEHPA